MKVNDRDWSVTDTVTSPKEYIEKEAAQLYAENIREYLSDLHNDGWITITDIDWRVLMSLILAVNDIPPADVKPVVRCKECKHYRDKVQTYLGDAIPHEYCAITGLPITSDFYCANGEKRANCGAEMRKEINDE